jgi:uncharacterized LabA/DUF88 family protein
MMKPHIAALFDAENVSTDAIAPVLKELGAAGMIGTCRAVGDFSGTLLSGWVSQAKAHGIELVMQPSLGKGKNSADIMLTIEAMDIAYRGGATIMALVTSDRDFAPLALRLRHMGIAVRGFGKANASEAFQMACTHFHALDIALRSTKAPARPAAASPVVPQFNAKELARLLHVAQSACQSGNGSITPATLCRAVVAAEPDLATRLSGNGKFLKTLVAHGVVERVGAGSGLLIRTPTLRSA